MSNTVITNYTDLNGPSTKADSSVVVIVNKDGSLSVDQNLLGTLMGTDGSQSAGISVVRVGHEGKPDDATDSENEDDKIPHVTLTVDSYYDEPNSIIKYDSGAEILQSLRIETRENSLIGFQNDHCYTSLTSPSQITTIPQKTESFATYNEPVIQITHTPPPKPIPSSKKITILEQQIIPKGKKIQVQPSDSTIIIKGNDALTKPLPILNKSKEVDKVQTLKKGDESGESSSISSSGDSIPDRDSDSDYKERNEGSSMKVKKTKSKPRILKSALTNKSEVKTIPKQRPVKSSLVKKEIKTQQKTVTKDEDIDLESLLPSSKIPVSSAPTIEFNKTVVKPSPKIVKKEKKTPAHVTALLSDITSLFSTPDVIRRVSTDNKTPGKPEKETVTDKKQAKQEGPESKMQEIQKTPESTKVQTKINFPKKEKTVPVAADKTAKDKTCYMIPQLDDVSLAQILQDTSAITTTPVKHQANVPTTATMNSPGLAGPLSPTLDLLGGLQPEEEGLTEDLLMHVAQLVESSENLQEVIDKQVLGKVDTVNTKTPTPQSPFQQSTNLYTQTLSKTVQKSMPPKKEPIEIVRRDGRVITLPPIEAPATRSSKRKTMVDTSTAEVSSPLPSTSLQTADITPEPIVQPAVSRQYINKKLLNKKQDLPPQPPVVEKISAESQESWNSEDDPNRLWCICKQPHNNRFMICCDGCEDWFHGKCVNITKAMGQQMEEQGIEWRCPNCIKKTKGATPKTSKALPTPKRNESLDSSTEVIKSPVVKEPMSKTSCIVCKKSARQNSIYCSNACILKHAQDSLGQGTSKSELDSDKPHEKQKFEIPSDSAVTVFERKTGKVLIGANAPTAGNLKAWLQKNPTFEVVRLGSLSTPKPGVAKKKPSSEPNKIQTTLNFERIPKKTPEQAKPKMPEGKDKKPPPSPREDVRTAVSRTPTSTRSHQIQLIDTPKPSTSAAKPATEPRKLSRQLSRTQSSEKPPPPSPTTSRRKDSNVGLDKNKMNSPDPIRDNVRKSLQEQLSLRMAETKEHTLTEDEIQQFANETEMELNELFKDVGVKYKAKYRSLMFNIKDRKNLTLWQKICNKSITPKQLVRLSPEELASQELAEWRDQEAKHQLELIKKSELDLLAASKTYVLKTHKGEEVMETKESISTELDPNVPVEDVVIALNDSTVGEEVTREVIADSKSKADDKKESNSRKREKDDGGSSRSKKSRRDSKRDYDRKSRSSRRKSPSRDRDRDRESKDDRRRYSRRSDKRTRRSESRDRSKRDSKEKSNSRERSRLRSRSREKVNKRSKSRERSRSQSKGRDRSRSRDRSHRRSRSREASKRHNRSRSKRISSEDKPKHRSRSQDNNYNKNKTDSTDSDSVERPKSAMLKDLHPEYDPHEPMITSAISEEDLRKSDEVYDVAFKNDIVDTEAEYDPSKFTLDTSIILPGETFSAKRDKISEGESDQEPSSTVENAAATVWNGCINMVDVARFYVAAHEVSGSTADLEDDLSTSTELEIVGRINPDTVWDYIGKTKKANTKDIIILRLQAANDEEKMQYIALYSYLSSRNRLGVVKVPNSTTVKDFYIIPLPANTSLPPILLPLDGPGLGDVKTHLLIAVIIRQRKKRMANVAKDIIQSKISKVARKRSYTPPVLSKSSYTPPTSPKRRAMPLPSYPGSALSTSVKDKIAASLACADDDEAYSPGSSNGSNSAPAPAVILPPSASSLRNKMEELNRQIEEQKQQILKMTQADSSVSAEDEAYSPSRPMTPPSVVPPVLADIALPSNLQEILATIKQRSENTTATTDVDMRTLPLP